jgi:CRP-like cAMP-binding protein
MEGFLQIEKSFLSAKQLIRKDDGEIIKLTATHKLVYSVMFDRYSFFQGLNSTYYETQEAIAIRCGIDRKTLIRIINQFSKLGVIRVQHTHHYGYLKRCVYTIVDLLNTDKYAFDVVVKVTGRSIDE